MRLGFVLGFLFGGGIATLLGQSQDSVDGLSAVSEGASSAKSNPLKRHVEEARDAATEAKLEKEAEMLRLYDDMVHRKESPEA